MGASFPGARLSGSLRGSAVPKTPPGPDGHLLPPFLLGPLAYTGLLIPFNSLSADCNYLGEKETQHKVQAGKRGWPMLAGFLSFLFSGFFFFSLVQFLRSLISKVLWLKGLFFGFVLVWFFFFS